VVVWIEICTLSDIFNACFVTTLWWCGLKLSVIDFLAVEARHHLVVVWIEINVPSIHVSLFLCHHLAVVWIEIVDKQTDVIKEGKSPPCGGVD